MSNRRARPPTAQTPKRRQRRHLSRPPCRRRFAQVRHRGAGHVERAKHVGVEGVKDFFRTILGHKSPVPSASTMITLCNDAHDEEEEEDVKEKEKKKLTSPPQQPPPANTPHSSQHA
jgi:hypothetical protein